MAFNRLADSQSKQLAALSVEHGGNTALTVNIGVSDGGAGRESPGLRGAQSQIVPYGWGLPQRQCPHVGASLQQGPLMSLCPVTFSILPTGRTTLACLPLTLLVPSPRSPNPHIPDRGERTHLPNRQYLQVESPVVLEAVFIPLVPGG